ncbi:KdsC family phosphatase [Chondrinema litorale]|uniref:KdsC family phosphatase n=1 Tax=Chondrinema litorale TaxID=2994555 RepID=UPI0025430770|nr:HAD-IIIA family hydrolase [Chondrinema litorale]UZR93268.1 HAD-IIIA family hydrolase [Chondrinema litorale]
MQNDSLFKHNLIFFLKKEEDKIPEAEKILDKKFSESSYKKLNLYLDQAIKLANLLDVPIDQLISKDYQLLEAFNTKEIKLFIVDIDGVMTDGGMYYSEQGDEFKKFNTKDGLAIRAITKEDFPVGIISSGFNKKLIQRRADLLGIKWLSVGTKPKIEVLKEWCDALHISYENIAYIGDDLNDLEVMQTVGLSACPADATGKIKGTARVILSKKGGEGCVREFIENYLSHLF